MMDRFYAWATALIAESKNEEGQTFVEYALILSLVALVVVVLAGWAGLSTGIGTTLTNVAAKL